jgi:hypothetical protein
VNQSDIISTERSNNQHNLVDYQQNEVQNCFGYQEGTFAAQTPRSYRDKQLVQTDLEKFKELELKTAHDHQHQQIQNLQAILGEKTLEIQELS